MVEGAVIAQWAATGVLAIGVYYSIRRNSQKSKDKDTELKAELKSEIGALKEKLDDEKDGLKAIKKSVDEQKLYCAKVSTALKTKVESMERDLGKKKKR